MVQRAVQTVVPLGLWLADLLAVLMVVQWVDVTVIPSTDLLVVQTVVQLVVLTAVLMVGRSVVQLAFQWVVPLVV